MKKRKVLLVGWDSADWKMIDKLMDAGLMPALKKVVDNGVRGRFATLDPPLSPMLWTSMATGKRPYQHGILGFVEQDGNGGLRPISSYNRKVKAFWNMFTMEGLKTNVVGWWPSNPVESINGVMVSNLFQQEKKKGEQINLEDWVIDPGTIYPESFIEPLSELRIHPTEIFGNMIMPFVPNALEMDKKDDKRFNLIAKFLAHSGTVHAACTELMETTEWDMMAVYHDALDHFSHSFMRFNPPKLDKVTEEDYQLFKDVVKGAYMYHDMMLERLLGMIDEDTTLIICSDHGFHPDHLRPETIPNTPAGPAIEHSPYGIFVAMGPDIKKGETIYGAKVLDLTPTLLTLFDLPIGRDMDGQPLLEMFTEPKEVKYIDSWENDTRYGGELVVKDTGANKADNEAALQQLIDLGYIDDINAGEGNDAEEAMKKNIKDTIRESNYYLSKSYSSAGKWEEALEVLLEIDDREKPDYRYVIDIIKAATKTNRFALAQEYLDFLKAKEIVNQKYLKVIEPSVLIGLGKADQALELLEQAAEDFPDANDVLLDLGRLLNVFKQTEKAKKVFAKVLENDPDNHMAYQGFGIAALRNEEYELALEYLLKSLDLVYHNAKAHLLLGETLVMMKEYEMALKSFEVVEAIAPYLYKTYRWLYDLNSLLGNEEGAQKYKAIVEKMSKGEKIILSGLPSDKLVETMIKIKESGLTLYGDENDLLGREMDITERGWLDNIQEDVIYLPTKLIPSLPPKYLYRVLYVTEEVEVSMEFLNRRNRLRANSYNQEFIDGLKTQDRNVRIWFDQQPIIDILYINHIEDLENDFVKQSIRIN